MISKESTPKELARSLGLKVYKSGCDCTKGHIDPFRYVSNGTCKECLSVRGSGVDKTIKAQWSKEYNNRPEIKERIKLRKEAIRENKDLLEENRRKSREREKIKKLNKEYVQKRNVYLKEYRSRPEVREKFLNKRRTPEAKAKAKEIAERYMSDEKVRANRKYKTKEYKQQNKAKILAATRFRQCSKRQRTVSWANLSIIEEIYKLRKEISDQTGVIHHVDHVIPLLHPLVCGLHVESNLKIITAEENLSKHNKFEII